MKKLVCLMAISVLVLGVCGIAGAVPLSPGAFGVTPLHAPSPGGYIVATTSGILTSSFGNYTGTYTQYVRRNSTGILFEYIITNDTPPIIATEGSNIASISMSFFSGFSTSADAARTINPHVDALSRSTGSGATIHFNYMDDSVDPGKTTGIMWIQTDAPWFKRGGLLATLAADTVTVSVYQPSHSTPEPASMMLVGIGLVGFVGSIFRRKFMA